MLNFTKEELLILSAALGGHTTAELRDALREQGQPQLAEVISPFGMAILNMKVDEIAKEAN